VKLSYLLTYSCKTPYSYSFKSACDRWHGTSCSRA